MAADKSLKDLSGSVVKIAESYPKIQKDVKDLRDAICGPEGILEAVNTISERLDKDHKKEQLKRLTGKQRAAEIANRNLLNNTNSINKTLNKILENMKSLSSKNGLTSTKMTRLGAENFNYGRGEKTKHLEGISRSVEIVERLRSLKIRDFIFAKRKMNNIGKIMSRSLNMFRMFKNQKEVDGTLSFVDSAIDIVKKLGKLSTLSKPAQWGEKAIEKIYLGKRGEGGLLRLFRKIRKHKRDIDVSHRSMDKIAKTCGSMLLTSMALAGIAVVGIPAMAGALLMKGVIWLLIGTYKMLRKSSKSVIKGSAVLLIMSASIITFGLGLAVMGKAVKDMKLKDIGIMVAGLAGMGLTIAGIGLLAVPISIGSASLLLMGASLGIFGLALQAWRNVDAKKSIGNVKIAVEGLRDAFGLELGKGNEKKGVFQRLGGGIMDIAMGLLNFGSSFFVMGSLLLSGAALGMLYHGLKKWDSFNGSKAASNIKSSIGALKEAFGIGDTGEGFKGKLNKLIGGPLEMGVSIMQGGKALAEMGVITVATGLSDMIRLFLIPWNKYDSSGAVNNLKNTIGGIKEVFGLEDNNKNLFGKVGNLVGSTLDMATTLMNSGGILAKMGTITLATGMADVIKAELKPWENYDSSKSIANINYTINSLMDVFGLSKMRKDDIEPIENNGFWGKVSGGLKKVGNVISDAFNTASTLMETATSVAEGGKLMAKMSSIMHATSAIFSVRGSLEPWDNYNSSPALSNINDAIGGINKLFTQIVTVRNNDAYGLKQSNSKYFEVATTNISKGINNLVNSWRKSEILKTSEIPFKKTVDTINAIDITKASIMIDLFKSFSGINKKPFDKFTIAVNKFAESSSELINALGDFSNNYNIERNGSGESTENTISRTEGVNINNPQALAAAIAESLKALPINIENQISDIRLVVNGDSGRRVVLTLED